MLFIIGLLKVVLVIVCLLLVLLVMMQRPKQEGLGAAFAQGMMNEIGGAHTANILQKATTYLGVMFFGISMLLSILISRDARASGALGKAAAESIGDKSAGTAGDPTIPLDFGPIPGVDGPIGVTPPEGGTSPEGGTTPEGGANTTDPETPDTNVNPDGAGAGTTPAVPEVPETPEGTSGESTPAPPSPSGEERETPDAGAAPVNPE